MSKSVDKRIKLQKNKDSRKEQWLKELDMWRNKFKPVLSREQAKQVLLDTRTFNKRIGGYDEPVMGDLYWNGWDEFCGLFDG